MVTFRNRYYNQLTNIEATNTNATTFIAHTVHLRVPIHAKFSGVISYTCLLALEQVTNVGIRIYKNEGMEWTAVEHVHQSSEKRTSRLLYLLKIFFFTVNAFISSEVLPLMFIYS